MEKGTKRFLVALLLVVPPLLIATIFVVLPKAETPRDEALPEGDHMLVAEGNVTGGDGGRPASGLVRLYWNGTGHLLRFEDYEAESGPNVWFFMTSGADPRSESEIEEEGLLVRVPGPGHATYRGSFNVPLPEGYVFEDRPTLVAWDRTFDTRYALAPLEAVPGTEGETPPATPDPSPGAEAGRGPATRPDP